MSQRRKRTPRRNATRSRASLSVVRENQAQTPDEAAPPSPIGSATESLLVEISQAREALTAEQALCDVFLATQLAIPDAADDRERLAVVTTLLEEVIAHAELVGSADALALLRVCGVMGPERTRAAAGHSADRLAATGLPERPWASLVGRPQLLQAWRYFDLFGEQGSVGLLFDYAGRDHAVMVLMDHSLGGGVKDCWVTADRRARGVRNRISSEMANRPEADFEDLDAAGVVEVLRPALAAPPCPREPDQIEDVASYLHLLQSRVDWLDEPSV